MSEQQSLFFVFEMSLRKRQREQWRGCLRAASETRTLLKEYHLSSKVSIDQYLWHQYYTVFQLFIVQIDVNASFLVFLNTVYVYAEIFAKRKFRHLLS